jgi:rhamnulokinase
VSIHERLYWDPLRLYDGVLEGLRAAARQGGSFASVALDGWGVDFALLDRAGRLLQNPVHYRDKRTEGAFAEVRRQVPPWEIFDRTGNQLLPINTLYQLWAMVAAKEPVLDVAERLLLLPDLFHYWLSGVPRCELTETSTTQCYDPVAGDWAWDLLARLGLPAHLLGEVVPPGTVLGPLRADVAQEVGLSGVSVITPASHDTASAIAAVPFRYPGSAYISSGTWSLVGMEVPRPVIVERAFSANLTNEAGAGGTFQLMSNGTGLWLLQECRRTWDLHGQGWEFTELVAMAESAPALGALVDPNDPVFLAPGVPLMARPPWSAACWRASPWPTARRSNCSRPPVARLLRRSTSSAVERAMSFYAS